MFVKCKIHGQQLGYNHFEHQYLDGQATVMTDRSSKEKLVQPKSKIRCKQESIPNPVPFVH